jgi:methylenetetrahydrofolate dehydrogenase (NADP+)/methenyltetrahydrofolate cyclohydrolase
MAATLIDGNMHAAPLKQGVAKSVAEFKKKYGFVPGLAVVLVGDDPASHLYTHNKHQACQEVGIASCIHKFPVTISQEDLLHQIELLNQDSKIQGILVQLPLPVHLDRIKILSSLDPFKDVDGLHPRNLGFLLMGNPQVIPCTPMGCLKLIHACRQDLAGLKAVIVGHSILVGKPMAALLLQEYCTVTITHIKTQNLVDECRQADILVSAVGKPGLIRGDWVKKGAIVRCWHNSNCCSGWNRFFTRRCCFR